jgi:hypothetical protein
MLRTAPPFRADHIGSLLRPPALKEARLKRERNEIAAEALRAVEDREIERAIKKNTQLFNSLGADSVPYILAKNIRTGEVVINNGALDTAGLALFLGIN